MPTPVVAKALVYMYVTILSNNGGHESRVAFTTHEACASALRSARIAVSQGAENESTVVAWCGGSQEVKYHPQNGPSYWRPIQRSSPPLNK